MKPLTHASLSAIGRQLQDDYSPALGTPFPSELKDLLARVVALDAWTRGPVERSAEIWHRASESALVITRY
jgi:hypothetical protein